MANNPEQHPVEAGPECVGVLAMDWSMSSRQMRRGGLEVRVHREHDRERFKCLVDGAGGKNHHGEKVILICSRTLGASDHAVGQGGGAWGKWT